ncbi:MAG: histidine phosphatase family protein [Actinomycetota bacterium]|nr:histidine phosphatase family protein [Actinomycetota bacterium]
MPRRLVLLRHAKSSWPADVPDHKRPLGSRGRREAPLAGRWLAEHVPDIELVVCSSAERTRQTWERVHPELATTPELRVDDRVYEASARDLMEVARELPETARTVLFIGHNPGLEDLIAELTLSWRTMLTSSIAVLSVSGDWADLTHGQANLGALETPRGV